jgi:predicted nucleic acid-binding protein
MAIVIHASIAMGWLTPSQTTPASNAALVAVRRQPGIVPRHFAFQVARALRGLERRNLITSALVDASLVDLRSLRLQQDRLDTFDILPAIVALARRYTLRIADAAYLELAIRSAAPLATRDAKLAKAATEAGATLFMP